MGKVKKTVMFSIMHHHKNALKCLLFFTDDHIIFSESEYNLQTATQLQAVINNNNRKIAINNMKIMAFQVSVQLEKKIEINNKTVKQIQDFNYLMCDCIIRL
jgi:hypothetical protein